MVTRRTKPSSAPISDESLSCGLLRHCCREYTHLLLDLLGVVYPLPRGEELAAVQRTVGRKHGLERVDGDVEVGHGTGLPLQPAVRAGTRAKKLRRGLLAMMSWTHGHRWTQGREGQKAYQSNVNRKTMEYEKGRASHVEEINADRRRQEDGKQRRRPPVALSH